MLSGKAEIFWLLSLKLSFFFFFDLGEIGLVTFTFLPRLVIKYKPNDVSVLKANMTHINKIQTVNKSIAWLIFYQGRITKATNPIKKYILFAKVKAKANFHQKN